MKKIVKIFMLCLALSAIGLSKTFAQEIVVRTRMYHHEREFRPMRPSPRHIWVRGEWVAGGGTYVWHAGYWALPPREGGYWIRGHWAARPGGYVWIPGHWA
jgi:hypothetical protein